MRAVDLGQRIAGLRNGAGLVEHHARIAHGLAGESDTEGALRRVIMARRELEALLECCRGLEVDLEADLYADECVTCGVRRTPAHELECDECALGGAP